MTFTVLDSDKETIPTNMESLDDVDRGFRGDVEGVGDEDKEDRSECVDDESVKQAQEEGCVERDWGAAIILLNNQIYQSTCLVLNLHPRLDWRREVQQGCRVKAR
jgi:hypothetical protein